jgi:alpha-methylacyl-CoA racemase
MAGPLDSLRIVEIAGIGPGPFAGMVLSDMGADVIRVDRPGGSPTGLGAAPGTERFDLLNRNRRTIEIDLKHPQGAPTLLSIVETADGLIEGFRPGVAERLGVGPAVVQAGNPRIVYGRLTGWGQEGPLAHAAGHSLNYEALTGITRSIGPRGGPPVPALNVLGDFAGGGLLLAYGVVCALFEAQRSGRGQVVDAAMIDGVMSLATPFYSLHHLGMHSNELGTNTFDGGAPFYGVYETSDGGFVTIAPFEPRFYSLLLEKLGLADEDLPAQMDPAGWPALRERFAAVFRTRTRDAWCTLLEGTDVCFAPVLDFAEAVTHPHQQARKAFDTRGAAPAPNPTPRLDRTPGTPGTSPAWIGADTDAVLTEAGFEANEIAELRASGAIA